MIQFRPWGEWCSTIRAVQGPVNCPTSIVHKARLVKACQERWVWSFGSLYLVYCERINRSTHTNWLAQSCYCCQGDFRSQLSLPEHYYYQPGFEGWEHAGKAPRAVPE